MPNSLIVNENISAILLQVVKKQLEHLTIPNGAT